MFAQEVVWRLAKANALGLDERGIAKTEARLAESKVMSVFFMSKECKEELLNECTGQDDLS